MSAYTTPPSNNIPVNFGSGGYSAPGSNGIPFAFGLRPTYSQTADLQSMIDVMGIYQDVTYTYLKECPTIIVGFSAGVPQFLKLPCRYGGVRDIGGYAYANPLNVDLGSIIFASNYFKDLISYIKTVTEQSLDIKQILRGWDTSTKNLRNILRGYDRENISYLPAYLKQTTTQEVYLSSYLKDNIEQSLDIRTILKGRRLKVPVNLRHTLKIWFYEVEVYLPSYVKQVWEQNVDLTFYLKDFRAQYLDLSNELHGWQEAFLTGLLGPFEALSLPGSILSTIEFNLGSYLLADGAKLLQGTIHGWDTKSLLNQQIVGVYGPYDIQSYLYAVTPRDLISKIHPFKGIKVPFDLSSLLQGVIIRDLRSTIDMIEAVNLASEITAHGGYIDVSSAAYPKIISVRSYIPISLLDYKDLLGFINQGCFGSGYKELYSSLIAQHAKDLRGTAFPIRPGVIVDLASYINATTYLVQDTISITLNQTTHKTVNIPVRFKHKAPAFTYDTINIVTGQTRYQDMTSYIQGMHFTTDLLGTCTAVTEASYIVSEFPQLIHEGNTNQVVIHLTGGKEDWRREVELKFKTSANDYYYLSAANKVTQYPAPRRWSLLVTGFDRVYDSDINRTKVRKHYLTDLRNYDTVDEAIRDLIDRVTMYRESDMGGYINATGAAKNLNGFINYVGTYSGFKHLRSYTKGIDTGTENLQGYAKGVYTFDLSQSITST